MQTCTLTQCVGNGLPRVGIARRSGLNRNGRAGIPHARRTKSRIASSNSDDFRATSSETHVGQSVQSALPSGSPPTQPSPPSTSGPEYDGFARAWKPPPGETPLWWVEKFEARRIAEARRKAEDPSYVTTQERVAASKSAGNPVLGFLAALFQLLQLLLVLAALLLLPAAMHDGGLSLARPFTTFAAYLLFFGAGSLARMLRHGPLTPRSRDRQVATWGGRLAFAAFATAVPLLHMAAMYRYVGLALYSSSIPAHTTVYDLVGGVGMLLAAALNALAGRELGAAYDRVAAPAALVTSGPYRYMQHPIYTSYMLLFFSAGMWLHSATAALALLAVCALYYRGRTALEARVLGQAFGGYYADYAARTKKFVPWVL